MNDKIVKKTQDSLGKIIKKPPMTEKLLNKPPFRFLHDVMTSVIKTTGFMKGLYTDAEMNSENVKDKDSKTAFLQKALDIVALACGKSVSARTSKIVAGHEPEKTNEFLQALAEAINKKPDNDDLVQRVLSGDKSGPSKPPSGSSKKEKEKDKEKEASGDRRRRRDKDKEEGSSKGASKDGGAKGAAKSRSKDDKKDEKDDDRKSKRKESSDRKHREKSRNREGSQDRERDGDRKERDKSRHRDKDRSKDKDKEDGDRERRREKRREKERDKEEDKENEESNMVNGDDEDAPARIPRPTSAKGSRRRHREEEEEQHRQEREKDERREREKKEAPMANGTDEGDGPAPAAGSRRMARPSSARPAPPRIKKNEPPPEEPHIVGQGAAPNVIVDQRDDDSDDEGFIAKEEEAPPLINDEPIGNHVANDEDADHGGLVKKILETKKELEGGSQQASKMNKKTEIERSPMNDAAKRKEREMVQKEIDKLRLSIQTLTRSANPLGKIMDFIQEDLDQMQKELEMWKKEHKENSLQLQREQSITENSIEPLKAQLSELDQAIADQLDLIAAVKSNIIRNDDRMEKMLSTVTQS